MRRKSLRILPLATSSRSAPLLSSPLLFAVGRLIPKEKIHGIFHMSLPPLPTALRYIGVYTTLPFGPCAGHKQDPRQRPGPSHISSWLPVLASSLGFITNFYEARSLTLCSVLIYSYRPPKPIRCLYDASRIKFVTP